MLKLTLNISKNDYDYYKILQRNNKDFCLRRKLFKRSQILDVMLQFNETFQNFCAFFVIDFSSNYSPQRWRKRELIGNFFHRKSISRNTTHPHWSSVLNNIFSDLRKLLEINVCTWVKYMKIKILSYSRNSKINPWRRKKGEMKTIKILQNLKTKSLSQTKLHFRLHKIM